MGKLPIMSFAPKNDLHVTWLKALLRPVVRFAVRHSIQIQEITNALKEVFIEVASEAIEEQGSKVTISRLSVLTGLQRKDIKLITSDEHPLDAKGLIGKIIGQWCYHENFSSGQGRPRVLSLQGENPEFHQLVESISTDLHPASVLFELERIGAVEKTNRGIKLIRKSYNPKGDLEASLGMLSRDSEDLGQAIEENVLGSAGPRHHHAKTEFDNIRPEAEKKIEAWFVHEGNKLHEKARNFLAQFDRDVTPSQRKSSATPLRVVLGSFSFIQENIRGQS